MSDVIMIYHLNIFSHLSYYGIEIKVQESELYNFVIQIKQTGRKNG